MTAEPPVIDLRQLARAQPFRHMTEDQIRAVTDLGQQRIYSPGEYLIEEGTDAGGIAAIIVLRGAVDVIKNVPVAGVWGATRPQQLVRLSAPAMGWSDGGGDYVVRPRISPRRHDPCGPARAVCT